VCKRYLRIFFSNALFCKFESLFLFLGFYGRKFEERIFEKNLPRKVETENYGIYLRQKLAKGLFF
jgi:hypothetical protein